MRRLHFLGFGRGRGRAAALFFCAFSFFFFGDPSLVGAVAPILFETTSATTMGGVYGGSGGTVGVKIAQKYSPPADQKICAVYHKVRQGSSGGGVIMRVVSGGAAPELGLTMAVVHQPTIPGDFIPTDIKFALPECLTLKSGIVYWFVFEPKIFTTFGTTHSFYVVVDQFPYTTYWQYNGFAFSGGWKENVNREWSLKLEGPEPPPKKQPVIIVPGILGSKLNRVSDGEEVWPNAGKMAELSTGDIYLNELMLDENGNAYQGVEVGPTGIFDYALLGKAIYGDLVKKFSDAGYASGTELFTVPYDWRLRIASSTTRLDAVVQKAIAESPTGKVSLVAHSMGGLLVKEYLRQSTSTDFVDKLVLVGVPELGSPKAFKALTFGDNFGFGFGPVDIFNVERSKIISQNMPGVYELLPSRKYFDVGRPYIYDATGEAFNFPGFDGSREFMLKNPDDSRNATLLTSADDFHNSIDTAGFNVPQNAIYRLVGCQNPKTIGNIRMLPDNEFDIDAIDGDGTVPLLSAAHSSVGHEYYALYSKTGINHMSLVGDERTLGLIQSIITGSTTTLAEGIVTTRDSCGFLEPNAPNQTTVAFSTHSPVLLHLYDDQGRHTGPDANGDIELGIPGSSYEILGDNSFVWAPGGVRYRVVIDATNGGSFDLKLKNLKGISVENQTSYLNVPLQSASTVATLTVAPSGEPETLNLDHDGDAAVDAVFDATAFLEGAAALDQEPPIILFENLTDDARYQHSESLAPMVTVADSVSGVATTSIELDGKVIMPGSMIDLFDLALGEHVLVVTAIDKAGNSATALRRFYVEAGKESSKADINRMLSLGWITKEFDAVLVAMIDQLTPETKDAALVDLASHKSKCYVNSQAYEVLKNNVGNIRFDL